MSALMGDFGKGFSDANLYNSRQFYLTFPDQSILYTVCRDLSWNHRQMAELFDVSPDNIGLHLKNIYDDGELQREATAEESSVVQTVIQRALESRKTSGHETSDHFRSITKMIETTARDEVRG